MIDQLHNALIESKSALYIAAVGGGAEFVANCCSNAGASSYFVGASMPYNRAEIADFLGFEPEGSYVSEDMAIELAITSFMRAAPHSKNPIGVGITAAVASDRLPRGEHRVWICVMTLEAVRVAYVKLPKGTGNKLRADHNTAILRYAEEMLEQNFNPGQIGLWGMDLEVVFRSDRAKELCRARPRFMPDKKRRKASERGLYLPTTMNPLHDGHRKLMALAEKESEDGIYLLSTASVHKTPPSIEECLRRVALVRASENREVELSFDDPLFVDKAQQRRFSDFAIGGDTLHRMLHPQWGLSTTEVLAQLNDCQVNFYVMPRKENGQHYGLAEANIPPRYRHMFFEFSDTHEASSTAIRESQS